MRLTTALFAASMMLFSSAAFAEDPPPATPTTTPPPEGTMTGGGGTANQFTKENYPGSFLGRPLILPALYSNPMLAIGIANTPAATGENIAIGFDIGLMENLQAGIALGFPVNPNAGFGSVFANLQYGLMEAVNLRLDLGGVKYTVGPASATQFTFGVGAPIKLKLTDMIAFTSGRSYALGGADNIITYTVGDAKGGTFKVPLGLLVQLHEMIAAQLRVGFAATFGDLGSSKAVPIGVDLMANLMRIIDVGFSFDLAGLVDPSAFADLKTISIWGGARF